SLRELRSRLQEPLHLGLDLEAPRGIAFERFLHDGCERLIAHQHLAVAVHLLVAITHRTCERPIAIHDSRAHSIHGLLAVLLSLMLADTRQQILDEHGVGVLAELDRRRLEYSTCGSNGPA